MESDKLSENKFHVPLIQITRKSMARPMISFDLFDRASEDLLDTSTIRTKGNEIEDLTSLSDTDLAVLQQKSVRKKFTPVLDGKMKIVRTIECGSEILCCKYDEEKNYIAYGLPDGVVTMFSTAEDKTTLSLRDADIAAEKSPLTDIQHRPVPPSQNYPISNSLLCSYANGSIKYWNHKFVKCIFTIRENRQTLGITYHPTQPKFISYGDDGKIILYNEETKTQESVYHKSDNKNKHDGHASRVFAACFHPTSEFQFLTGGWDNVVQFWDLRMPHAVKHLFGLHLCGKGIDISPRGNEILISAWQKENPLQLYDYNTAKLITTIVPDIYNSKLYCGKYITKDFAVTGGADPSLFRVIDLQTHVTVASIMSLPGAVYCFDTGVFKKPKRTAKQESRTTDITSMPKIAIVSGQKIFELDFT